MANIANPSEKNPTAPGYTNPLTGAINPGYPGYPASPVPFKPADDPAYSQATTYATGQAVTFDGKRYVSLVNSNVANRPDASPTFWSATPATPFTQFDAPAYGSVEDLWKSIGAQFADMKKKDTELETTLHQLAVKTNQFFHS